MNPTKLEIGYQGVLQGRSAEVVGRATLKNSDGYRWDEYYVKLDGKDFIILVYEKGAWKRFAEYKPESPIDADTAETIGRGESIEMGFKPARVTYVGHSVVTFAEGEVLEGVRLGSEAEYFNADVGTDMLVVSWTGQEIEFYMGSPLPRHEVSHAFGLPEESWLRRLFSGSLLPGGTNAIVGVMFILVAVGFLASAASHSHHGGTIPPLPIRPVDGIPIAVDSTGSLGERTYTVVGRWKGEIDQIDMRYQRYEYFLTDKDGNGALLVEGEGGSPHTWMLFTDMGLVSLSPTTAATYAHGANLTIGGRTVNVETILLSQTIESVGKDLPDFAPSTQRYGFIGACADGTAMVRWDEKTLHASVGHRVIEAEVLAAFPANALPSAGK